MSEKKFFRSLFDRENIYIWLILAAIVVSVFFKPYIALIALSLWGVIVVVNFILHIRRKKKIVDYIENLSIDMDVITKSILIDFPMPLVMVSNDGRIVWYNNGFKGFFDKDNLLDHNISDCLPQIDLEEIKEDSLSENEIYIKGKIYSLSCSQAKTEDSLLMLYFSDQTANIELKKTLEEDRPCAALVVIDNYEELMQGMEDADMPLLIADIDSSVSKYFSVTDGVLKKYERDKYLVVFKNKYIKEMMENRFELLDIVKGIDKKNLMPVTLSIGIGLTESNLKEEFQSAVAAIDIALGRGGDQVVIKDKENFRFFGGKSREIERRTKVKARVVANALKELIVQADNVIIMGHEKPDFDAIGAAVGLYALARSQEKMTKIVANHFDESVKGLVSKLQEKKEYAEVFVKGWEASEFIEEKTLLIIVDTFRRNYVDSPELVDEISQIAVIDHHRKGADFIKNTVLTYQEAYASSTCELVAEILQYVGININVMPEEAEAMYAGILMDTKDFSLKTGVRTFEAAAFLRKQGIDIKRAKGFMESDFDTYNIISNAVSKAKIIDGIAITYINKELENISVVISKIADELLKILGIKASFVLGQAKEEVCISGRSSGEVNVQVILEKLGGGGHFVAAGAQLRDTTIMKARKLLEEEIAIYNRENKREA